MAEMRLRNYSDDLQKVYVNEYDDFILINPGDHSFFSKFADFLAWINEEGAELDRIAEETGRKYEGREMISEDEDGNTEVDTEQLLELTKIRLDVCRMCNDKVDALFGQDTLKKYFRVSYEVNPDFVPDVDCIFDFVNQITPALEQIYHQRADRISKKYNRKRKGRHNKTKEELIAEAKKAADADE